jgi:filamentous hemagglutinin family protein
MNRIYRLVWNAALSLWVAVAENAKGCGKGGSARSKVGPDGTSPACMTANEGFALNPACRAGVALLGLLAGAALPAIAGPAGGVVSAGAGTIAQGGAATTINQSSQRMAIDWNSFSTAAGESVVFVQPNAQAIALNRVVRSSPSELLGSLSANGQVFILNPNGVLFGAGSQVNVGGLVASSLSMSNADFMAGSNVFTKDAGSSGGVINRGTLTVANGGYIALLAPEVRNEGVISATLGTALLAAGNKVTLNLNNGSLLGYSIDQGAIAALADNKQLIQANGGQVILSARAADALSSAVVNNTGVIEAKTLQNQNGRIMLMGDMVSGQVNLAGKLDASAPNGGDGGFIETSAAHVKVATGTTVTTQAANGKTGNWLIDPSDYTVAASGGDITGADLTANLATTNVTLQSSGGSAAGNGDINVNDNVSLAANTLTLTAARDININAVVTVGGVSTLEMNTGTSNGADAGVAGGAVKVGFNPDGTFKGRVDFPGRSGSGILTINGSDYTVINALGAEGSYTATDLQGIAGNSYGNYALGADIDASATSGWAGGQGFLPLNLYGGRFDGLGHTISNLTINRPNDTQVGLFGTVQYGALRNAGVVSANVTGQSNVGLLAGYSYGTTITNSYSTGNVAGYDGVGGLIGNSTNDQIANSHSAAAITGVPYNYSYSYSGYSSYYGNYSYSENETYGSSNLGGLVGRANGGGTISNSYATGAVSGNSNVGGLVGTLDNSVISDSYASGAVQGTTHPYHYDYQYSYQYYYGSYWEIYDGVRGSTQVGGLVGRSYNGSIDSSQSSGPVSGTQQVGGLIGMANGTIVSNSYSTARVDGAPYVNTYSYSGPSYSYSGTSTQQSSEIGGLIGSIYSGSIQTSSATGDVSGSYNVGGLAGTANYSTISASSAVGNVTGQSSVGGLIGSSYGTSLSNAQHATGTVTGGDYVGGLVGIFGNGTLDASSSAGAIVGTNLGAGGLVGQNEGTITGSSSTATVDGYGDAGGLVGRNFGSISGSSASGAVSGAGYSTGGLVGYNEGSVTASQASGNVSGLDVVGGLIGYHNYNASVTDSSATGSVSGNRAVGGLVGSAYGIVSGTYATGAVSGDSFVGGLLGESQNDVSNSYATGNVSANARVGGLIGQVNGYLVTNSYATGNVTGGDQTGGLVGWVNGGNISNSYATGSVSGTFEVGGFAGYNGGAIADSYWNTTTSGQASDVGAGNLGGATGKTSAELTQLATFANWDIDAAGGTGKVWRIYEGNSNPLLRSFLAPLTLADVATTYNGATQSGAAVPIVGALGGTAASGRNAGTYNNAYSNQQGYDISGGALAIGQAALTLSSTDVTKVYDGDTTALGTAVASGGTSLFGTDTVSGGAFAYTDKNAGTGKSVTTAGVTVNDGNGGANYAVSYADNTSSTITPRALTVSATGVDKVYDGNTTAAVTLADDRIADDVLTLSFAAANFADKNVGAAKSVTATGIGAVGADAGNYSLNVTANTTAAITPRSLTVTANGDAKFYDGKPYSGGKGVVFSGFVAGDTAADLTGSLVYGGSSQGAMALGRYVITPGGLSGNYAATYVGGELAIAANSQSSAALGGPALVDAYESVLQNEAAPAQPRAPQVAEVSDHRLGKSKLDIVNCGVLMPKGVNVAACE